MKDLTSQKFGRLKAVCRSENIKDQTAWYCQCECGNSCVVQTRFLTSGSTKSCGCIAKESAKKLASQLYIKRKAKTKHEQINMLNKQLNTVKEKYYVDGVDVSALKQKKRIDNKSGVKGVSWDKTRSKWKVSLQVGGKNHNIGRFETLEDAKKAREIAEEKFFKPVIEKHNSNKNND